MLVARATTIIVSSAIKTAMSYPLLADSLNLETWSLGDFKTTTKSKQRYAPIMATGRPVLVKLSSNPLACPFGIGKFQDIDSGRISLDLIVDDESLIRSLESIDEWAKVEGGKQHIKGTYKPLLLDNERYGNKKVKVKVQLDTTKFWSASKLPYDCLPELRGSELDCVVQVSKVWVGVDQWGVTLELRHALVHESMLAACPF